MSISSFMKPLTNPVPALMLDKPLPQTKDGSAVPSFEKSVIHAAAHDALKQLNEVNAFTDAMAEEWLASSQGAKLRNVLRDYIQHGHVKSLEV